MANFPVKIDCNDFALMKLTPTDENATAELEGTLHKYFLLRGVSRDMKMYAVAK